jgi:hypothetical protein
MPAEREELPPHWHRLDAPGFSDVQWTFEDAPELTCNGILVVDRPDKNVYVPTGIVGLPHAYDTRRPSIAVFDPDGRFPLTLDRTRLAGPLPFAEQLEAAVAADFLAFAITRLPEGPLTDPSLWPAYLEADYPGWAAGQTRAAAWMPWWCTVDGVSFLTDWSVGRTPIKRAILFPMLDLAASDANWPLVTLEKGDAAFAYRDTLTNDGQAALAWHLLGGSGEGADRQGGIELLTPHLRRPIEGRRVVLTAALANHLKRKFSRHMRSRIETRSCADGWVLIQRGDCPEDDQLAQISKDAARYHTDSGVLLAAWYCGQPREGMAEPSEPLFGKVWRTNLDGVLLPFSMSERKRRFAAFLNEHSHSVSGYAANDAGSYGAANLDY